MPQFIRFNLFPLQTTISDADGNPVKSHNATRTIVTDDEVFVYQDDTNGPSLFFHDRLEDFSGSATEGWTAETTDGYTVSIIRSSGCGCGSRLKGYNPFPGVPFEKMLQ